MTRLLLFDIDGTLLHSNGAGREMLGGALRTVYGTAGPIDTYEFGGRTDRRMVLDLLTVAGWPAADIEARLPALYAEMRHRSEQMFSKGRLSPCPGVQKLLAYLHDMPGVLLGLLTGNIVDTAPLKLRAAGLDPGLFRIGAYGSDSIERNDLLPIAWLRAEAVAETRFSGVNTTIIGDTPADVDCAQNGHARSVAVATGWYTRDRLSQCRPDYIFDDLSNTESILDVLLAR